MRLQALSFAYLRVPLRDALLVPGQAVQQSPRQSGLQYPGEFVPTILCVAGVDAGWFAEHEAKKTAAPAAQRTRSRLSPFRSIGALIVRPRQPDVKPLFMGAGVR